MSMGTKEHMDVTLTVQSPGMEVDGRQMRQYNVIVQTQHPDRESVHTGYANDLTLGEVMEVMAALQHCHSRNELVTLPYISFTIEAMDKVDRK